MANEGNPHKLLTRDGLLFKKSNRSVIYACKFGAQLMKFGVQGYS